MRTGLAAGLAIIGLGASAAGSMAAADADLAIRVNGTTYYDNGANDIDPTPGIVTVQTASGDVRLGFVSAEAGGAENAVLSDNGERYTPIIQFSGPVRNVSDNNNLGLTIEFSLANLTTTGNATFAFGAGASLPASIVAPLVSVTWDYYLDHSNQLFGTGQQLAHLDLQQMSAAAVPEFGGTASATQAVASPYALTGAIVVTGLDGTSTIGDLSASVILVSVPEPMSLLLLGTGLVALGLARRQRA